MKELTQIIVLLNLSRPKYFIDVLNSNNGNILKKNYSKETILTEISHLKDISDWFLNLPLKEFQINVYVRNGSRRLLKATHYIDLKENATQSHENSELSTFPAPIHSGLNGGQNMPQLLANQILFEKLSNDFNKLKMEHDKSKLKIEKLKDKVVKRDNKLLLLQVQGNQKSFLETEAGQGLLGAIPQILEVFAPTAAGLNAAQEQQSEQEKLSPQQNAFIEFIKTLTDTQIIEINALYKAHLQHKQQTMQEAS